MLIDAGVVDVFSLMRGIDALRGRFSRGF